MLKEVKPSLTTDEEDWWECPATVCKSHSLQNKEYYSIFKTVFIETIIFLTLNLQTDILTDQSIDSSANWLRYCSFKQH